MTNLVAGHWKEGMLQAVGYIVITLGNRSELYDDRSDDVMENLFQFEMRKCSFK